MMRTAFQRTLRSSAGLRGRGLHTGEECEIEILPADPNSGVVFSAGDDEIRAVVENVRDTNRGTTLSNGKAEIHTVEHLLAALAGMLVDNARIRICGPEIPAADGSALPFVELIESAGIIEQDVTARIARLREPVRVGDDSRYLRAEPAEGLKVSGLVSFAHPLIGEQAFSAALDPETFNREIAPARTFCTSDEIEAILALGLGKGGTEDNVIVVHEDHYSTPLRFDNEFVRHKVLDLIGDLSLIGKRLYANVTGVKTSHFLNIALTDKIARLEAGGWQGG